MKAVSRFAVLSLGLALATACAGPGAEAEGGVEEARAAAPAPELSDAEIAHVAVTANAIDVELAGLAESRADRAEVQTFARTMIADHGGVNERAGALAGRLGVTPADNAISRSLREDAAQARERLVPLSGADFDRGYMEREVAYHETVLEALDGTLIPATRNAELRGLLEEVRPVIAAHLGQARAIRSQLEPRR